MVAEAAAKTERMLKILESCMLTVGSWCETECLKKTISLRCDMAEWTADVVMSTMG